MSNRLPLCCLTRQLPAGPPSTLRLGVYTETEARSVTQRVTRRVMREVTHTAPRWHAPCCPEVTVREGLSPLRATGTLSRALPPPPPSAWPGRAPPLPKWHGPRPVALHTWLMSGRQGARPLCLPALRRQCPAQGQFQAMSRLAECVPNFSKANQQEVRCLGAAKGSGPARCGLGDRLPSAHRGTAPEHGLGGD